MTADERVRVRLQVIVDTDVWSQADLAKRLGKSQPWLQKILSGENALRLKDLDHMADVLGVPPAELIRADDNELLELRPTERRMIRAFRAMSDILQQQLLPIIDALGIHNRTKSAFRTDKLMYKPSIGTPRHAGQISASPSDPAAITEALRAALTRLSLDAAAAAAGEIPHRPLPGARADKTHTRGLAD